MRFNFIYYLMILLYNVKCDLQFSWDKLQEKNAFVPWFKSMNNGKWIDPSKYKDKSSPYFKIDEKSIYAIKHNAKVSMDIKNIQKTEENVIEFKMHNLKIHSIPYTFSVSDYKAFDLIYKVIKNGLTFKIQYVNNSSVCVEWSIFDDKINKTYQKGIFFLSNIDDEDNQNIFRNII